MARKALIIAGTDTNAGKTVISGAILRQYGPLNGSLYYWKPVQTGYPKDDDTATVRRISGCDRVIAGLRFREPVSPHLAAELEGKTIDPASILEAFHSMQHDLILEGAGGLLVPINRKTLWMDVLAAMNSPVLLVARAGLGTINHTLLSLEALGRRRISVVGIAFYGAKEVSTDDNMQTIADWSGLPVFGPIHYDDVAESTIDPGGLLGRFLGA
jgi:dethiobiotin synthetase